MRLLYIADDGRLTLTEYLIGDRIPPYAILSHSWQEGQEVTFDDLETINNVRELREVDKNGYRKIMCCAQQAKVDELDYVWVDTCCIDKSSSSELQEAINSMFNWYKRAAKCYVYLSDTPAGGPILGEEIRSRLQSCRWFTRGWTLQELIAAKDVTFFDRDWEFIGSKEELVRTIAVITGIDELALSHGCDLHELSIAKRLSWAARRQTTRIEDQAYCLLGLLDINMTLIYGEGKKAFRRLQDELIKKSADGSLFLWSRRINGGILAPSPSDFFPCGKIVQTQIDGISHSWEMTHLGLRLTLPVIQQRGGSFLGILACRMEDDYNHVLALKLKKHGQDNTWIRPVMVCSVQKCTMHCENPGACVRELHGVHTVATDRLSTSLFTTILIPLHNFQTRMSHSALRYTQSVWIRSVPASLQPIQSFPDYQWNLKTMTFSRYKSTSIYADGYKQVGAVLFSDGSDTKFAVCFAVSCLVQFIEVICRRDYCLESICKGLDAATSHRYSDRRRAHHAQHACGTANVHVQAVLNSEMVMGEEVWVIDLTLAPKRTPLPMDRENAALSKTFAGMRTRRLALRRIGRPKPRSDRRGDEW
jgi:hypothetical protein